VSKDIKVLREKELARFELPRDEAFVVRIVEYEKGGPRLDMRRYYTDENGESRPTSKGASVRPEWIGELRSALDAFATATLPKKGGA
jgi:hypothetical protein